MSNEIGRLLKRIIYIEGKYTCFFIQRHEVTQYSKVTYRHIVYDIITHKKETHRVQLTLGSDKLTYDVPVYTPQQI